MHHSGSETSYGGHLFGSRYATVSFNARGNILAHGNDVTHAIVASHPHRDLAY